MKTYSLLSLLVLVLLTGCSTTGKLSDPDIVNLSIEQAKKDVQKYRGSKVRWGGSIVNIKNHEDFSTIEILRYPLYGSEPDDNSRSAGRFLAKVSGFVDPQEYKSSDRITVTGKLQALQKGKVGNYPYSYPVIQAEKVRFFKGQKVHIIRDPYWWSHPYHRPWPYWRGNWW